MLKDDRISTSKQRQFVNVKSTLEFDVENNVNFELTLKKIFVLISLFLKKQNLYINRISTPKQRQFINVKPTSKFNVETLMILG